MVKPSLVREAARQQPAAPRSAAASTPQHGLAVLDGLARQMRKTVLTASLAVAVQVGSVHAQTASAPPPFTPLRYNEDYSYLRDRDQRSGAWWEPFKFIPFDSAGWAWLSVGDEVRFRYERYWANNFGSGSKPDEDYLRYRQMPYAALHLGSDFTVFGQMIVAYAARDPAVKNPFIDETGFDVLQGFIEWRAPLGGGLQLSVRAGRQVLVYGSGRLINAGPNIRTAFDGAVVQLQLGEWRADAFFVRPVRPELHSFDDGSDRSRMLWSLYVTRALPSMGPSAVLDFYYIGYENDLAEFNQGKALEHRHTLGTRFAGSAGAVEWDLEGNVQLGRFGRSDTLAWCVATDGVYRYTKYALRPWVGLRLAYLSGDGDPSDGMLGTFNPMFAEGGYFGENGVLGPNNLMLARPGLGLDFGGGWSLLTSGTVYWRASLGDGMYGLAGNLLRPSDRSTTRSIGPQFDVALSWQANRHLGFAGAYSVIIPGGFVDDTGPSWTVHFIGGHAMFRY